MMKRVTLKELRTIIRRLVENDLDDEFNRVEIGDIVDVDVEEMGILPVRVISFVDDVRKETGYVPNDPTHRSAKQMDPIFQGPGFVGKIDPESGESGEMVFSFDQVMPGSKAAGYFPKLGFKEEWNDGHYGNEDNYGRTVGNPYRRMAKRFATKSIEPQGSYASGLPDDLSDLSGDDLDEADADHVGDPRWDDHADPTGKEWSSGLEERAKKFSL